MESGVEAGLALSEDWVMVDLEGLPAMVEEYGLVLDSLCERCVQEMGG